MISMAKMTSLFISGLGPVLIQPSQISTKHTYVQQSTHFHQTISILSLSSSSFRSTLLYFNKQRTFQVNVLVTCCSYRPSRPSLPVLEPCNYTNVGWAPAYYCATQQLQLSMMVFQFILSSPAQNKIGHCVSIIIRPISTV